VKGIANLGDYKLDLGKVVLASEWTQATTKNWRSEVTGDPLKSTFASPGAQDQSYLAATFDLPMCDLEHLIAANPDFMSNIGHDNGN
jgi:hypothetical protein